MGLGGSHVLINLLAASRFQLALAALAVVLLTGCGREDSVPTGNDDEIAAPNAPADNATPPVTVDTVLVIGATGRTGRRVVSQLLQRGYGVRAFVRDEARAREKLGPSVEYVAGDVRDAASVAPAFVGMTKVISALGSSGRAKDPTNSPEAVDYGGVKTLAEAAATAGVQHFVLVSSMGATIEDHPLNKMFDNILRWKFKGEQALRASGVPYTIVRPAGLTEEPGGESEILIFAEDAGEGTIPRADVAALCLAALEIPDAINKTLSVMSGVGDPGTDLSAAFAALPVDKI